MASHTRIVTKLRSFIQFRPALQNIGYIREMSGEAGSGAGKGGGTGGSVRDAGGSMGKRQAAQEEQYFMQLQRQQLAALKDNIKGEIEYHQSQIDVHKEALDKRVKRLADMEKK